MHGPPPLHPARLFLRSVALAAAIAGPVLLGCSSTETTATARDAAVARLAGIPSGDRSADRAALDEAMRQMRALAHTEGCADGSCAVIGLGAKPCGGPWEYVAYCPTTTDVARLKAAADEVLRAERAYNERYGITASDCSVAPFPEGSCTAKPAAARAP